ncbi:MAG TPA: hypothetical protein VF635_09825, partial [Propionibacteriaceae bacterium]
TPSQSSGYHQRRRADATRCAGAAPVGTTSAADGIVRASLDPGLTPVPCNRGLTAESFLVRKDKAMLWYPRVLSRAI